MVADSEGPEFRRCKNASWPLCLKSVKSCLPGMVFCAGLFCLLTGMLWVNERGLYSRSFYWLIALPALCSAAVSPRAAAELLRSRIFLVFLLFACYMSMTLLWANSELSAPDLLKRPLFVALMFLAIFEFGRRYHALFTATVKGSAVFSVFAALYTLYLYFAAGGEGRLVAHGALSNPLLVSHVFGFFLALWLGYYFCKKELGEPFFLFAFMVLLSLLFATGSRTPLLATLFTVSWLAILTASRKGAVAMGVVLILGCVVLWFFPESITQRGFSHRTEIWAQVIGKFLAKPWFGHGFGTPLQIQVGDLSQTFVDSHNLTLSVFYSGGILGGVLWIAVYATALVEAWRRRRDPYVLAFSAIVVYGLAAGLTEGGAFFSRPKEHWSLVWIPMALLSYAIHRMDSNERAG